MQRFEDMWKIVIDSFYSFLFFLIDEATELLIRKIIISSDFEIIRIKVLLKNHAFYFFPAFWTASLAERCFDLRGF